MNKSFINMFIYIEIMIGLIFLIPHTINPQFRKYLEDVFPLIVWSLIFIIGGFINLFYKNKWLFVFTVSVPLLSYGLTIGDSFVKGLSTSLTGFATYTILGIYGAIYSHYLDKEDKKLDVVKMVIG